MAAVVIIHRVAEGLAELNLGIARFDNGTAIEHDDWIHNLQILANLTEEEEDPTQKLTPAM